MKNWLLMAFSTLLFMGCMPVLQTTDKPISQFPACDITVIDERADKPDIYIMLPGYGNAKIDVAPAVPDALKSNICEMLSASSGPPQTRFFQLRIKDISSGFARGGCKITLTALLVASCPSKSPIEKVIIKQAFSSNVISLTQTLQPLLQQVILSTASETFNQIYTWTEYD